MDKQYTNCVREKFRLWLIENSQFIQEYNKITEDEGLPLDRWRSF
ncbi:type II toxin-antitoxin system CcdA family antitoxin [Polynucleobacter sp. Tro8-14-1]|nr:type II toxin-antitoxin system CcdA family antitoxin [Polynucleobacter sp. Tro8-14-1]